MSSIDDSTSISPMSLVLDLTQHSSDEVSIFVENKELRKTSDHDENSNQDDEMNDEPQLDDDEPQLDDDDEPQLDDDDDITPVSPIKNSRFFNL
ncbi:unnamed protein product [Rotaria sordida]|nr:unnamed protein product [Rotaria sordida]CAF3926584.1 unnamed protein product [Rotaria sordida]